ncbi:CocE/NonD family hydrolase [Nocardioides exalbidus]|uniref:CocE/NonD family hydrolase n=1 Tax=Nocardioides exalbidus TaxID=402596 RepID=UPI000A88CEC6|nr:CocE/NonD family hydrolase [Nocardioides exalbidus]
MTHATHLRTSASELAWEPVADGVWRAVAPMRTRDGTMLVADVYAGDAGRVRRPVLLERTPYGRRKARPSDAVLDGADPASPEVVAARFVARGFVVVRQDCRGRGDSEGRFTKYVDEAEDGYDSVAWAAAQPWSDGRVATMGVSYSAHAQTALAALHPEALVAMFVDSGGFASAYESGVRMGGAFELKQATWALRRAAGDARDGDSLARQAVADEPVEEWFRRLPWRRGHSPLRHVPAYEDYFFDQWEHEDFGPWWTQPALYARGHAHRFPDVPSLHLCSWYDPYVRTAVENFQTLSRLGEAPVRLVLGPWTHGRRSDTFAGDVDLGPEAALEGSLAEDYVAMRADWFTARLAGVPDSAPPVRWFLMGGGPGDVDAQGRLRHGGRWRTADTWPPGSTAPRQFHLHPDGVLAEAPPAPGHSISWDHDPADPVPTIGGR